MSETAFCSRFSLAERTEPFPSLQVESAYELNQGSGRAFSPLEAPPASLLCQVMGMKLQVRVPRGLEGRNGFCCASGFTV